LIDNPSWQHFATHDESEYPELWEGVRGYWAPCLGPSGTRLHDVSGLNNWGTLTGISASNAWVAQDGRAAISLDFSDSIAKYATIPNSGQLNLGVRDFSVHGWARPTLAGIIVGRDVIGCHFSAANPYASYGIEFNTSGGGNSNWNFYIAVSGNNFIQLLSSVNSSLNVWYHVVGTYSATGMRIYVNGVLQGSNSENRDVIYNNQPLTIGQWPGGFNAEQQFVGQISEAAIWRRVLSDNEIRLLYQIGRGGMLTPRRRRRAYFVQTFSPSWAIGSNVVLQPSIGVS
jgi:hypothetical protein